METHQAAGVGMYAEGRLEENMVLSSTYASEQNKAKRMSTLSHFENGLDITACFMSGRTETCTLLSVRGEITIQVQKVLVCCIEAL